MSEQKIKNWISDATVLLTGASSGIGYELGKCFGKNVKNLILVARREDRLEALKKEIQALRAQTNVFVIATDLRTTSAMDQLIDQLQKAGLNVDILVNNAGHGDFGLFQNTKWERTRSLIDLNLIAPTYLIQKLLPNMIARKRGAIMNISSTLGLFAIPGLGSYVGSKHYLCGLSETLTMELKGTGVEVCQICPGPVATEFDGAGKVRDGDIIGQLTEISAQQCAEESYRALLNECKVFIPGKLMGFLGAILRTLPKYMHRIIFSGFTKEIRAKTAKQNT